jgi:hypothetical protein
MSNVMERHLVEVCIPQGLPVSPILVAMYMARLIKRVEERVCQAEILSFVDDVGWVAIWHDVTQAIIKRKSCSRVSFDLAERWELEFDTVKTESAIFSISGCHEKHLRPKLTAMKRVGNGVFRFNREGTRWQAV